MNVEQGMDLSSLIGMVRRRGKLAVRVAGGVMLAVFWVSMALPNRYESSALILVEPQSIDEKLVEAGVKESDLSQRLGIMSSEILSRARLSTIITKFDLYPELADDYTREEIVEFMRGDLSIAPVLSEIEMGVTTRRQRNQGIEDFNTFSISYRSISSTLAAKVVNELADDFISEHIDQRVKVTQKSLDFMTASIEGLRKRIAEVEGTIAEVKAANPNQLPENLDSNERDYNDTLHAVRGAQAQLAEAISDEAFWKSQVIAAVSMAPPTTDQTSPEFRKKMVEMELAELRAKGFTEKHPDIVKSTAELAELEAKITANRAAAEGADDVPASYAEQNARAEKRRATLRIKTSKEDLRRIQTHFQDVAERIAKTPAVAEQLDALNREYTHLLESFQDYSARREQAHVQADLERKQLGEQLRILEAAGPAATPSSPKRILLLGLGWVMGLGVGGVAGFLVETGDSSLHVASDLQLAMNIPVLAEIPKIMLESDRMERSRRLMREGIVTAAVVLACLFGGVLTYLWVNGMPGLLSPGPEEPPAAKRASDQARSEFSIVSWQARG